MVRVQANGIHLLSKETIVLSERVEQHGSTSIFNAQDVKTFETLVVSEVPLAKYEENEQLVDLSRFQKRR